MFMNDTSHLTTIFTRCMRTDIKDDTITRCSTLSLVDTNYRSPLVPEMLDTTHLRHQPPKGSLPGFFLYLFYRVCPGTGVIAWSSGLGTRFARENFRRNLLVSQLCHVMTILLSMFFSCLCVYCGIIWKGP